MKRFVLPSLVASGLLWALHAQAAAAQWMIAQADPLAGDAAAPGRAVATESAASSGAPASGGASSYMSIVMMLGVFGIFYFMVLRPQQKKANQHKQFLDALQPDASVVTTGGIYGKVVSITDQIVTVEIADRVRIRVHKSHVAGTANNAAEALANQQR